MNVPTPREVHQNINHIPTASALLDHAKKYVATLPGEQRIKLIEQNNLTYLAIPVQMQPEMTTDEESA